MLAQIKFMCIADFNYTHIAGWLQHQGRNVGPKKRISMSLNNYVRREFVNQVSQKMFKMTKAKRSISSAYHPETNSIVERFS